MSAADEPGLLARADLRRLLWCTVTGFTGFAALLSVLPLWAVRGGASTGVAGSVTTVTLAATVATQFAVPAVVARRGTGPALAAGLLLLGAPAPLYALSGDLGWLLALSAVRGVGFGLLTVVGSLLVALLAPPGAHGRTAGVYGLAIALPNLVAVPGGVLVAQNVSFPLVLAASALPVLGARAAWRFGSLGAAPPAAHPTGSPAPPAPTRGAAPGEATDEVPGGRTATVRAARGAAGPAGVLLVVTLAGGGVLTFVPIALPEGGLLSPGVLLALGVTAALGRWLVGSVGDRMGAGLLLLPFLAVTAVGVLVIAAGLAVLGPAGPAPGSGSATLLLAGALLVGAGYGAVQNLTLVVAFERAGPGGSATASAVWNAAFDTGTGTGAVAVGALAAAGAGLPGAFTACGLLVLGAAPLALRLSRRRSA